MEQENNSSSARASSVIRRIFGVLTILFGITFFLCLGIAAFFRFGLGGDQLGRVLVSTLSAHTPCELKFSSITLTWPAIATARMELTNLEFLEKSDGRTVGSVSKVAFEVDLFHAMKRVLLIRNVELSNPVLILYPQPTHRPEGKNVAASFLIPVIERLKVVNGKVVHSTDGTLLSKLDFLAGRLTLGRVQDFSFKAVGHDGPTVGEVDVSGDELSTDFAGHWRGKVSAKINNCPAAPFRFFAENFKVHFPVESGLLNGGIELVGNSNKYSLSSGLGFSRATINGGPWFNKKTEIENGLIRFKTVKDGDLLDLEIQELDFPGINIGGSVKISEISSEDPKIAVSLSRADVDLRRLFPFIPLHLLKDDDRTKLADAGLNGHLLITGGSWEGRAGNLSISEFRNHLIFVDAYLDKVSGFIPGLRIALTEATGTIRISINEIIFKGISFVVGSSPIVLNGWLTDINTLPKCDIFMSMTAQVQDLKPILENKSVSRHLGSWLGWMVEAQGATTITLDIKGDLTKPEMKGRLMLEDFQCRIEGLPLPLKKVNGVLRFRGKTVTFTPLKGLLGDSPLEISGSVSLDEVDIQGELKLAAADLKKTGFLPAGWNIAGTIPITASAKGKNPNPNFSLSADLKSNSVDTGAWIKKKQGTPLGLEITGVKNGGGIGIEEAYVVVGDGRISAKGSVTPDGKLVMGINLPPRGIPTNEFIPLLDPALEIQAGGRLEGDFSVRANLDKLKDAAYEASLQLSYVSIRFPGMHKRTDGITGTLRKKGKSLHANIERAKVGDSVFSGNLSIIDFDRPKVDLGLDFSFLDTTDFTAPPGYVSPYTWAEWIRINRVIRLLAGSRSSITVKAAKGKTAVRTFSDFKASFEGNNGIVKAQSWQMNFADGTLRGNAVFDLREDTSKPLTISFHGARMKIERIFSSNADKMRVEGEASAEGQLEWRISNKRENGGVYKSGNVEVRLSEGIIHRFEILSKIFSLVNLGSFMRGRFPDIITEGLPFHKVTFSAEIFDNKWKIKELKLFSDAARIDATGMYFSGQEKVDFRVEVSPLVGLDTILSSILGTKDGKTLTTTFRIRGFYGSPDIRLEPFEN